MQVFRNEDLMPQRNSLFPFLKAREFLKLPQSLATSNDYKVWRPLRTVMNEKLFKPEAAASYVPRLDPIAKEMTERLLTRDPKHPSYQRELEKDIFSYSTECISSIVFGDRIGVLNGNPKIAPPERAMKFVEEVDEFFQVTARLIFVPPFTPDEQLKQIPDFQRLVELVKVCMILI